MSTPGHITVTNKSNSRTFSVASSVVCTSPLAVTTIIGFFDILTVSKSASFRSFLLTMCMLAPESLSSGLLWMRPAKSTSQKANGM